MNPPIKNKAQRTFIHLLLIVQILVVIKLVLLKDPGNLRSHFKENYSLQALKKNIYQGNYIPFYSMNYYFNGTDTQRYTKENLAGNVLLFFPFGILLPLLFRRVNGFQKILLISFIVSMTLELIQLFAMLGNFDIDDIILNMLGASLGFGTYILIKELKKREWTHISE
jgi:glycopeptide antibiotics resistance protein